MEKSNLVDQDQLIDLAFDSSSKIMDEAINLSHKESSENTFDETLNGSSSLFDDEDSIDFSLPFHQVLFAVNRVICNRLDAFEGRLDTIAEMSETLRYKMKCLSKLVPNFNSHETFNYDKSKDELSPVEEIFYERYGRFSAHSNGLHFLNHEQDFPNGSWLGDENKADMRIRCQIPTRDLFLINKSSIIPEKMALTLLDHLFDKQVLATSNISGTGKHNKKKLDPLMICGIWCHLKHIFGISNEQWHRIKQNLDSKCRSAFRNKRKLEHHKNAVKRQNTSAGVSVLTEQNVQDLCLTLNNSTENLRLVLNGESSNCGSSSSLTSEEIISNQLNTNISLSDSN